MTPKQVSEGGKFTATCEKRAYLSKTVSDSMIQNLKKYLKEEDLRVLAKL